jgi:hypothetical protein
VLWPATIGIALCGFGIWSGLVYENHQAEFRADAVQTRAVIDQIYTSAPSQGYSAPTFDEYALVHFFVLGERAQARVLLASDCTGTCVPVYRVGQVLTVDYSRANSSYAQLPAQGRLPSPSFLYGLMIFGLLGVIFLGAAVVNIVMA